MKKQNNYGQAGGIINKSESIDTFLLFKIDDLERKYDEQFKLTFDALRILMDRERVKKSKMGFKPPK